MPSIQDLLNNYSIEMTAKDVAHLEQAADVIPKGTKIPVTFLPGETFEMRIAAAKRVKELGFLPIPHISARRLSSQEELEGYLAGLQREVGTDHAFVVAGDPPQPMGPYEDALSIIRSGLLAKYGIKRVGISGYPEGHPEIGNEKLWQAMRDKQIAIQNAAMTSRSSRSSRSMPSRCSTGWSRFAAPAFRPRCV